MKVYTLDPEKFSCVVVLATFNGAEFLGEQLRSLVNQSYTNFQVFIRDDDSQDNTREILKNFEADLNIVYQQEIGHVGIFRSYISMLKLVQDFKYVALCDQDDVWETHKLMKQINNLESTKKMLSICDFTLIDKDGKFQRKKQELVIQNTIHAYLMIRNTLPGHSYVFRGALLEKINFQIDAPHDWQIALFASKINSINICAEQLVRYRQHDLNFIGNKKNVMSIKRRLSMIPSLVRWRKSILGRDKMIYSASSENDIFRFCLHELLNEKRINRSAKTLLFLYLLTEYSTVWLQGLVKPSLCK